MPGFGGFRPLRLPAPRQVFALAHSRPGLVKAALGVGNTELLRLPGFRGRVEIMAEALLNSAGAACSISLRLLIGGFGGTTIGDAIFTTDKLDNDGVTLRSIAANTPGLFRLTYWPTRARPGACCVGETAGGVIVLQSNGVFITNGYSVTVTETDNAEGPLDLSFNVVSNVTGAFTLDRLTVLEYPSPEDT